VTPAAAFHEIATAPFSGVTAGGSTAAAGQAYRGSASWAMTAIAAFSDGHE
jgi:hypothetical protein